MEPDDQRRGSWVGWAFALAAVVCLVAAANSWHVARSFASSDPGGWMAQHTQDRAVFWLTWAGVAALAAGVVWAVGRWSQRAAPPALDGTTEDGGAPTASSATAGSVVVEVPPSTRLDWKVPTSPRPLHWTDRLRWVLGVGWVALLVSGVAAGARVSTFDEVRSAVASGEVREVTVAGRPPSGGGWAEQEVTWREGVARHRAVVTASSTSDGSTGSGGAPDLQRDAADVLLDAQPALVVHRSELPRSGSASFLGWYLPAPQVLGPLHLAGALVLLFLVLNVPPTWRLTRWAWFWIGCTPVGAVLFALFAGPTPGLPRPRHPEVRIGGVIAFVVSLVAGGLLHWGSP
ncbi:hypothetical protein FHN55_00940 [Streptomyces sp. NP160]|uniref:hypothetical protein n=1 Tax=Streptomyces sp. NP160 TaxID=2586637 RepID=UPI0011183BDA|nr:hypothetical protein [Streptomyces sp. NP160]TNM70280.1 hypothetical protein FHN55_00940 [Streptomyces sp. NP160]